MIFVDQGQDYSLIKDTEMVTISLLCPYSHIVWLLCSLQKQLIEAGQSKPCLVLTSIFVLHSTRVHLILPKRKSQVLLACPFILKAAFQYFNLYLAPVFWLQRYFFFHLLHLKVHPQTVTSG